MNKIWTPSGRKVFCPLCDEPFRTQRFQLPNGQITTAYFCKSDNVMIFPFDPMFDKWRDHDKKIPCPSCKTPMKWFGRMLDCYMKCECPACGLVVEKDSDMTIDKGEVHVEDMEEPQPEVIDLQIPIDKLNLSPEKKAQLRKRVREKRNRDGN